MSTTQQEGARLWIGDELVCGSGLLFGSSARLEYVAQVLGRFLGCGVRIDLVAVAEADFARFNPNRLADWVAAYIQGGEATRRVFLAVYTGEPETSAQECAAHWPQTEHQKRFAEFQHREQARERERQRRADIRRLVKEREIKHLMHFTRVENLPGITELGLLSRAELGNEGCVWNDDWRRDGRLHAVCLSVSYPNYKMFYRYRTTKGGQWAVLLLDPCLLWERDCGFVEANAASGAVWARTEDALKSVDAFERMFAHEERRTERHLPPAYPTNPQAEVLVFEGIEPSYIREIHLESAPCSVMAQPSQYRWRNHVVPVKTEHTYFRPRHDHAHWPSPVLS